MASLLRGHRELIEERLRPPIQREQPRADRIVLTAFLATFYGWLAFIALDVFHLRLLGAPEFPVSFLGLVPIIAAVDRRVSGRQGERLRGVGGETFGAADRDRHQRLSRRTGGTAIGRG